MKINLVVFMIVILFSCICVSAQAAGKLNVIQENFYTIDNYGTYSYAFAKIENSGNKDIQVNNALLEVFDSEGDAITSTDWFSAYGKSLAPGEYCYVRIYTVLEGSYQSNTVDDYMLTVTGKSTPEEKTIWLDAVGEYRENVNEGYWTNNYMYGTVTNNSDKSLYNVSVAMALLDEEENILFLNGESIGNNCALAAGSSVTFRIVVDDSFTKYFEMNNLTPKSIDVIAYAYLPES